MSQLVAEYRAGLRRGELLIQRCGVCGNAQMYPRYRCTRCQSAELGYEPVAGRGTLLTYTVVRAVPPMGFENDLPYALGVVRLEEGVQLLGRLLPDRSGDWSAYGCDAAVEFATPSVEEIDGRPVAWFRLSASTV